MTELIIAEKPNAAKKIADALADGKAIKNSENKVPYYEVTHNGKDILIGCAVGHLYTVAEKDKKKGWSYPVFSMEWKPTSDVDKKAAFAKKYLTVLKKLCKRADEFTIATDYDIEGEVIGVNILKFACKQKDGNRMKFSTLTKPDLVKSYENKQKHLDWGQAKAGLARHELDWLYGINLSRALTLSVKAATGRFKLLSSGRVQGPALKIIVDKEKEIKAFKPEPFRQLVLLISKDKQDIESFHEKDKFFGLKEAEDIYSGVKNEKQTKVDEIKKTQFKQSPPVPFDLTSMQVEAHRTLRFLPSETLSLAQELYTSGVISYPRTSSQKLPQIIGYKKILQALSKSGNYKDLCDTLLKKSSLIPNEGKKTDEAHPAIYPTGQMTNIDGRKAKLYDLIVRRFLAVFAEPALRETIHIIFDVLKQKFVAKGTRTIEQGWHKYYGSFVMLKEVEFPPFEKGETLPIKKLEMLDKETTPPKRYTAASIIKELEKRNLGTKSTRAQIVENLYNRGYIDGRSMTATELGIRICDLIQEHVPRIVDEALTRHFEEEMDEIRHEKKSSEEVIKETEDVLTNILNDFKKNEKEIGEKLLKATDETRDELTTLGKCPKCKVGDLQIRKGRFGMFIACNKYPDCKTTFGLPANAMFRPAKKNCEVCGLPMIQVIRRAKRPEEVCINPKCKSKTVEDDEQAKKLEDLESGAVKRKCPKCGEGDLVVRKSIYGSFVGCNRYPKCRYLEKPDGTSIDYRTKTANKGKFTKKSKSSKSSKK